MTHKAKRPNRCTKCSKLIREEIKSGLCSRCYRTETRRENNQKKKIEESMNDPTTKLSLYGK